MFQKTGNYDEGEGVDNLQDSVYERERVHERENVCVWAIGSVRVCGWVERVCWRECVWRERICERRYNGGVHERVGKSD